MSVCTSALKVMIAGIGGASLGTEIAKCLALAKNYRAFGCDISPTAYGLYDDNFEKTFRVDRNNYVAGVIDACRHSNAAWLIAGGEQPMTLLSAAADELSVNGITLVANTPGVVQLFSDKAKTFQKLVEAGIGIPRTEVVKEIADVEAVGLPCIVKPATGSGGSASVFFAVAADEAMIYAEFIRRSGHLPLAQEYVDAAEGEFTIGVLSLTDGEVAGSIALKRTLDAKLSLAA